MAEKQVSVIIPTLNEEGNIKTLIRRIVRVFEDSSLSGEILFVDDHSTDGTRALIESQKAEWKERVAIRLHLKQGKRGKAHSLIEGFRNAEFATIVMIDADLQYPPEAIPKMVEKLSRGADIVVANRAKHDTGIIRSFISRTFSFVFSRLLHDLECDAQSGLKVFKKKLLREVVLDPSPWTFDMEFLLSARNYGYVIETVNIVFAERRAGTSKLSLLGAIFEIGWSAIKLKWKGRPPLLIHPETEGSMHGAGIAHNRKRFITHTTLHHQKSALHTFVPWQRNLLWLAVILFIVGLWYDPLSTGIAFIAVLSAVYFIDVFFNLGLVLQSLKTPPEIESTDEELASLDPNSLPIYSVLCPLYKEAHMLPMFVEAMEMLNWPKAKLEVLLLLEENDQETVLAAQAMGLPEYIRIIVVPHSMPKTKPKACNYGVSVARGEYVVIYDAEDIPDVMQLKKAYLAFQKVDPSVRCLQAKLNYFNPHQNMLTRLFTAEYSLWFDVILTGLQTINTSIPLGGTSNHFRTADLLELEGWDPFNVTEDCDLGVRLFKHGYRTAIIDSVTLEEANSDVKNWLRQRSRWIKGYMQTYLVHMRHPFSFVRENGVHALIFQLVVGGKIAFMIINPILWLTTIAYFSLYALVGPTIQSLFPPIVFYMAAISLVFGNFLYIYYYMIGCAKRKHFWLIKYVFFVPFYWVMVSIAATIAAYQLFVKPHYWEKTNHGLHLVTSKWVDSVLPKEFIDAAESRLSWLTEALRRGKTGLTALCAPLLRIIGVAKQAKAALLLVPALFRTGKEKLGTLAALQARMATLFSSLSFSVFPGLSSLRSLIVQIARPFRAFKKVASPFTLTLQKKKTDAASVKQAKEEKENKVFSAELPQKLWKFAFSNQGLLMAALIFTNFVNFLFNAYLGRVLSFEEFSLVTLMNTLWFLVIIAVGAFSTTVNHKVAYLEASEGKGKAIAFFRQSLKQGLLIALGVSALWIVGSPFLAEFFHIESFVTLLLFTPVFAFSVFTAGYRGFLQGSYYFTLVAIILAGEALVKFLLAVLFVTTGLSEWVYLSIPLSIVLAALLAIGASHFMVLRQEAKTAVSGESFPRGFFAATLLFNLSAVTFLSVDIILVNHYLEPTEAGEYGLLALVGKIIYFFGSLASTFLLTFVSRNEGLSKSSKRIFSFTYAATSALVVSGVLVLGVWGDFSVPFLLGEKAHAIIPYLLPYTIALAIFTLSNIVVTYHLARKEYLFPLAALFSSVLMATGIILSHGSLESIVKVIFLSSVSGFLLVELFHLFGDELNRILGKQVHFIWRAGKDLAEVFTGKYPVPEKRTIPAQRILIFNWRDLRHTFGGGAELYIEELSRQWVKEGSKVTLFCGNDGHSPRNEKVEGVQIIRRGGFYLVYFWAFVYYMLRFRGRYDVIIDCQNGIPFFTPLYAKEKVYCLMHHVHQEVFRLSLWKPLAIFASFLEKDLMPLVYKNVKFITVSESSKFEMEEIGLGQAGIEIVHPGVHLSRLDTGKKSTHPTILYLGRLKAYKSVDVLIRAFQMVIKERPEAKLIIAGSGEEEKHLKKLAKELRLHSDKVEFLGKVTEEKKIKLLQSAWVAVNPSFMEGWGIVVIEANACGTPVIASDIPGLCDSVRDAHTGYLVEYADTKAFAESILLIIRDARLRETMEQGARKWAERFDWGESSAKFLAVINND